MTNIAVTTTEVGSAPAVRGRRRRVHWNPAYGFIAPSVILIAVFIAEPIVQSAWMSLHTWSIGSAHHRFVGLGNYTALWHDNRFWNAFRVTCVYTVAVGIGQIVLGLAIALRLQRTRWYTVLLRTAFFFPFIASLVVTGIVWQFLLDPQIGLIDGWLHKLGFGATDWLQSTSLALPTVIAVGIWKNVGFAMIVLLAALQTIPSDLYEAATLDGASWLQRLRFVSLPALRPAILFTSVIATINGLQLFDLNYVMTSGGPLFHTESVVMYLFQRGFIEFKLGYATAISMVLFAVILAVSLLQLRLGRDRDDG
jgi:multiple sugar transport system permease protein/raffinose/stachyose/melibiose transport system permease protein